MAGKQLGEILKSIERQLFKLVLSHTFNLATQSVRIIWIVKGIKKPHAQKFADREREATSKKNCIRNNHSKSPHSPSPNFECEELQYKKKALKSHQGNYTT